MNEETKIKIKMPFFEKNELEFIDNNIHDLAHKFTEQFVKEKDLLIAQRIVKKLEQELQRKDNIINMIIEQLYILRGLTFTKYKSNEWNNCLSWNDDIQPILDKIKELEND